jgi:hypothetical protein
VSLHIEQSGESRAPSSEKWKNKKEQREKQREWVNASWKELLMASIVMIACPQYAPLLLQWPRYNNEQLRM